MKHDIRLGDCFDHLKTIPDNSIDLCLTDPPYFIDGLGDDWDSEVVKDKQSRAGAVGGLPTGMKFDPRQGKEFQDFMHRVSVEVYRVLKPGAFYIAFSQARLYHRLGVAVEDVGFEIRDMLGWTYSGQAKAFSQDHIIRKQKDWTEQEREDLIKELAGWKTAQLRPCIEPMTLAQKPAQGKLIDNWRLYQVGLMNTYNTWEGQFPGNLVPCSKPTTQERGENNTHVSVKPVRLCEHLIKLFTTDNAVVFDPFLGSGTTAIAAERTGRRCVGFELSPEYYNIIQTRLNEESKRTLNNNLFEW
jgi:site-specific DNA-methyltransferase (adenine-specific)